MIWSEPLQMQPRVLPLPLPCSRSGGFPGVKSLLVEANLAAAQRVRWHGELAAPRGIPSNGAWEQRGADGQLFITAAPPPFLAVLMAERLRRAAKAFCFSLPD